MSYQNRWRDAFILMLIIGVTVYMFDLRDLRRQHEDLENALERVEIIASLKQPEQVATVNMEAPSYLELLTHLLREYHLLLIAIESSDDENYQIKMTGSYAELRQFTAALTANSEFIINDVVIVSESVVNAQVDLNIRFSRVSAGKKFVKPKFLEQYISPFCSAVHSQSDKSFHRDDISLLGTVRRNGMIHSVVMYPNGLIAEIN
ncbi:MAG TPA: hypothetical protein VL360_04780 [Gammaproteobacteria bacterium]|nr:hypothetical protein [Gammaproteobacteria bacterium]